MKGEQAMSNDVTQATNMREIHDLLQEMNDLKCRQREIVHILADRVIRFKGSLQDALGEGIVKLNFPAPPGFYNAMRGKVRND